MLYALRRLQKSPGFASVAVATLALGIGANTALFSVVNAMLLRQLPFAHSDRLVWIWSTRTDRDKAFYSLPDFIETQKSNRTLDGLGAYANWGANFTGVGEPERLQGARITAGAFTLMGVSALQGRTLTEDDGLPTSDRVALLTFGLWQRRFGADPNVVGQKLVLNGDSYRVVGVLPPAFVMVASEAELYVPLVTATDPQRNDHDTNFLRVFGRLKPGITPLQAAADLAAIEQRLRETFPDSNAKHTDPRVLPFLDEIVGGYRTALWTLLAAVALVLLIACTNLANLLLARASSRAREVAVRRALGATRLDLIRLFLAENSLLAALGGALGVAVARVALPLLLSVSPTDLPRTSEVALDGRVLLFAIALTLTSALIFGLAPALHASRLDFIEQLKARDGSLSSRKAMRNLLAVAEVALSIVLLTGAGLFLRTFLRMQAVSPGIATDHLLLMRLSLPKESYSTAASIRKFYDNLRQRVALLPGVESVALGSVLPLSGMNTRTEFYISGRTPASPLDVPAAQNRWVSPGYFRTMHIPVIEGREFTEHDSENSEGVAVVDRTLAKKYWPDRSPLGSHFRLQGKQYEVVGVVGDIKHNTLDEPPTATVYGPYSQVTPGGLPFLANGFSFIVRTGSDPMALATAVRRELHGVDGNVPAASVKTMDQFLAAVIAPRRFNLELMLVFAAAALLLAVMGVYGLISFSVALRTSEIGMRMALGADPIAIVRLIVGQGLRLVFIGITAGLLASVFAARAAQSLLFDTSSVDPVIFAAAAVLFAIVGAAASYLPARRAMRVDPMIALRSE